MHRGAGQGLARGPARPPVSREGLGRDVRNPSAARGHQRDPGQGVLRAGDAHSRPAAAAVLQRRRERDAGPEVRVLGQQEVRPARRRGERGRGGRRGGRPREPRPVRRDGAVVQRAVARERQCGRPRVPDGRRETHHGRRRAQHPARRGRARAATHARRAGRGIGSRDDAVGGRTGNRRRRHGALGPAQVRGQEPAAARRSMAGRRARGRVRVRVLHVRQGRPQANGRRGHAHGSRGKSHATVGIRLRVPSRVPEERRRDQAVHATGIRGGGQHVRAGRRLVGQAALPHGQDAVNETAVYFYQKPRVTKEASGRPSRTRASGRVWAEPQPPPATSCHATPPKPSPAASRTVNLHPSGLNSSAPEVTAPHVGSAITAHRKPRDSSAPRTTPPANDP
mmetsp:Transcript_11215/g.46771  ORF Transcript_11215/g.46771 Transcript_11215/m.46771 type:complete len:395 (-) Transcript_11215:501-1685(-)